MHSNVMESALFTKQTLLQYPPFSHLLAICNAYQLKTKSTNGPVTLVLDSVFF